jgi:phosphopantothenoylcysteine decarboxylase/phosphopantothenate--cysteine ligase
VSASGSPVLAQAGRLVGKHLVVGVTGGIAAYKAAQLVRLLLAEGAVVDVVMSRGAREFVGSVTFEGLTGRPVRSEVWEDVPDGTHVELGRSADAIVIYPATAHTLARLAHGLADDLLTTTVLAHVGPLVVAPAMHTEMWAHQATSSNVMLLRDRGTTIVGPATGPLMGGDVGAGRAADPEEVRDAVLAALGIATSTASRRAGDPTGTGPLSGRRVLVTAGGTREAIDPVRFLGNRSSGRMGFALAAVAMEQGADVALIAAPTELATPLGVLRVDVTSAREMDAAVRVHEADADLVIMAAAVADFRPDDEMSAKWRRADGPPELRLVANPDILAGIVERRGARSTPIIVGFAAQTGALEAEARAKLAAKGVDVLVANDVARPGIGFESDSNAVLILHRDGTDRDVPLTSKRAVAEILLSELLPRLG